MVQKLKNVSAETWLWYALALVNVMVLVACMLSCVALTHIHGNSMNPTLADGDSYMVTSYASLDRGDIVIANTDVLDTIIVKRVIGVPGDTIAIAGGMVYRNGQALSETYIAEAMQTEDMPPVTLGKEMYFLMGDNRNHSCDSRMIGPVPREQIRYVLEPGAQPLVVVLSLLVAVGAAVAACWLAEWETRGIMMLWARRKGGRNAAAE